MDDPESLRPPNQHAITDLLQAYGHGDTGALDEVAPLVYDELRRIAHLRLRGERQGGTLRTTGLVHEAFIKFTDLDRIQLADRTHFYALSAHLMRQILVDYARRRRRLKRGGVRAPEAPDEAIMETRGDVAIEVLMDLDRALEELASLSRRQVRVIECRYFAGMTVEETAEALGISPATVKRDWQLARAWLNRALA